ncbi:CIC11C00000005350 [Sungouiella intermedia]|uniref:Histone deacetylase n=1 Tax=Sungouiella intermedia TaxID=45354 RepID=A0A1L0BL53_9ASCO|nr:CIC11C00000005350 [[Candida] intermedia]
MEVANEKKRELDSPGPSVNNMPIDTEIDLVKTEPEEAVPKIENGEANGNVQENSLAKNAPLNSLQSNGTKRPRAETAIVVVPYKKPELFYSPLKTGLVYDVRMRYHAKIFTSYFEYIDPHPEDPRRIYRIYKKLAEAGLVLDKSLSGTDDIGPLMEKIPIREATADEILEVHTEEHLKFIASTEAMSRDQLLEETEKGDSIYVNNDSFLLAKLSCGGLIEACKAVVDGRVKNSLAIVRPPGHHAEPDAPGGFCLFSNVAVAAKNILKSYPDSVRRIVILDWDIHHGNGTQRAFYDDPRVLYISLHRYENGKFYPGTKYGGHEMVGDGKGEGFSVNIPWQNSGVGDADYVYAFRKIVIPIISEFDPDLVIVSAGFDAADGDLIGQCHVTPAGYGQLTHMLKAIARGKLTVILEGGYNLDSISKSALAVAKVLIGEPPEATITTQPRLDAIETVSEVMKTQSKYWKCMKPSNPAHVFEDIFDLPGSRILSFAEPIRAYQAQELFSKYGFINLPVIDLKDDRYPVFSTDLPSHLDDLVLASPDINECSTVVVCIHDPPEVWANINPVNGYIESSTSVVLEHPLPKVMNKILDELSNENVTDKVGYIDINVPSYIEAMAASLNFKDSTGQKKPSNYNPTIFAQELLLWVWDNYLTYFPSLKKLVFVGFGDAYQSIVHLYAKRPSQEIKDLVQGTIVFVSRSTLKSLVPVMDESMVDWYYQNSVIFTSHMNPCWSGTTGPRGDMEEVGKRPRRKFGRVLKSSVDGLWDVIQEKFDEGVDFILDSIVEYSGSESS